MTIIEDMMTPSEVCEALRGRVVLSTLARWRRNGTGPKFVYVAGSVLYERKDVENWIEKSKLGKSKPKREA